MKFGFGTFLALVCGFLYGGIALAIIVLAAILGLAALANPKLFKK